MRHQICLVLGLVVVLCSARASSQASPQDASVGSSVNELGEDEESVGEDTEGEVEQGWPGAPADSPYQRLGAIEREVLQRVLEAEGLEPEHAPVGKTVCRIRVHTEPVFTEEDPYPDWLNRLRFMTRERTVERALTLREGDEFTEIGYRDAERELRSADVYSFALVVPTRSDDPECVDLLALTKDVWSLRLTWFVETAGAITSISLGVYESNLLGLNDQLAVTFERGLGSWSIGPAYFSPRFGGTRWQVYASNDVIWDRERSRYEGMRNLFQVARPLYSSAVRWSGSITLSQGNEINRRFVGSEIRTYDARSTVEDDAIEERWRQRDISGSGTLTRSYGLDFKHNLSTTFTVSNRDVEPLPYTDVGVEALREFQTERLPREETAIGPGLSYQAFENRYMSVVDYDTYGFNEEIRLGVSYGVSAGWGEPTIGSTNRFLRLSASTSYRLRMGSDGFVQAGVSQSARLQEAPGGTDAQDQTTSLSTRWVSPRTVAGRAVIRGAWTGRTNNVSNSIVLLGADSGVRGYATGTQQGEDLVVGNAEWRFPSFELWSARIGGVMFADAGTTWFSEDEPDALVSVGLGARLVIPQLGTEVRALDIGFPLRHGRDLRLFGRQTRFPTPVVSIVFGQPF